MNWKIGLFITFVVLNILDFISTKLVVDIVGPSAELNPLMYFVITSLGIWGILFIKSIILWGIWIYKEKIRKQ